MPNIDERSLQSGDVIQKRREADVKAGRGYINDIGEYVPYKGGKDSGWDKESIYTPPRMKKRQDDLSAVKKSITAAATAGSEKLRAQLKDSTPEEKAYPDIYKARKEREARSKYFPQTGTRSDEEKGFFSGLYDKTVGEYQRGQEKKERIKEHTKAAMAAEPDPFVKKEIARKGHEQYMKIAASEGQGERDREAEGGAALALQKKRDKEKYEGMAQHAAYRDREMRDKELGAGGNTGLDAEAERLRDARVRQESIEREEGPQVHYGTGDEGEKTGFIQKNLRDLPLVGGLFGEKPKDLSGDGQVMEEAYSKFKAGGRLQKAPWEVQKEEEKQKRLEAQSTFSPGGGVRPGEGGLREPIRDTSEAGREEAESQFARSQQPTIEDDPRLSGKGPEFEREYEPDEFTQDQARDAISTLKPDEGDAVVDEIKAVKGQGPEWLEAKEALRDENGEPRYVQYQGSGLVIDMAVLGKDIDRNHFFKNILPNVSKENRAALMAEKGYFPDGDLSIAQKKSAKEIKEIEILNLQANKLKLEAEKLKKSVPADKQMLYKETMTGFRQAVKDKDWDSASMFASELRGIGLPLKDFDPVALEAASNQRLLGKEPHMLNIAKKHGIMVGGKPSLTPFYKQQGALSLKLAFLGKDSSSSGGTFNLDEKIHTGSKITFGEILNNNGIETWDKVKGRIDGGAKDPISKAIAKAMGLETLKGVSREAYLHYAKSKAHDVISRSVWGDAYDEIKQGGAQGRIEKEKAAQDAFDPSKESTPPSSYGHEDYKPTDWVKVQGTPASRAAAKKAKAEKVTAGKKKAHEDEITKDNRVKVSGRQSRQKTNAEKKVEYMKEGTKRLDALVKGQMVKGQKKALGGHPKFNSTEEAVKFYKNDPKGKKLLKKMSLAFRHFISQK